ncbi:MAG: T9SS type A sorting domain-containing protein, partial [Bacteroidota bacterium]
GFSPDYWIIKADSLGNKQWDKDIGGTDGDVLLSSQQTIDGGYILGGYSNSGIGGDKTQVALGYDYWVIKIDSIGIIQWDKDFGGSLHEDDIGSISQTVDGGYLVTGNSYSNISGDKSENNLGQEQIWIVKTNSSGTKQWDKTIFTTGHDETGYAIQTKDECYVIANGTYAGTGGYKTQASQGSADYWFIKFCDSTATTAINEFQVSSFEFQVYPNPAQESLVISHQFAVGDEIRITDTLGKLLFTTKIKTPTLNFRLQTSNLASGIYFIKAGNEVRKFVKE